MGSMIDIELIRTRFDRDQRRDIDWYGVEKTYGERTVRSHTTDGKWGFIGYADFRGLDSAEIDALIDAELAAMLPTVEEFEWKIYDYDEPHDLKERLTRRGLSIGEAETVLVFDLETVSLEMLAPVTHDVRRIGFERIDTAIHILATVWGEDYEWMRDTWGKQLRDAPQTMSMYAAYVDDIPASVAWIAFHGANSTFASLWGGSTLAEYRGKGLYRALLATRIQEARARGVRYLTIDASPMSHPIVERLGFVAIGTTYPCEWKRELNKQPNAGQGLFGI